MPVRGVRMVLSNLALNDRLAGLEQLLGEYGAKHSREAQKQDDHVFPNFKR